MTRADLDYTIARWSRVSTVNSQVPDGSIASTMPTTQVRLALERYGTMLQLSHNHRPTTGPREIRFY